MSVLLRRKPKDVSRKTSLQSTSGNNDSTALSSEVQKVLEQLKRLDVEFSRFQLKSNGITKTNILRTLLLPFLRDPLCEFKHLMNDRMVYLSLTSISTNTLIKWWKLLLICVLNTNNGSTVKPPIVTRDRNAYLEGISRIVSRYEWNLVDQDTALKFQLLLTQTLIFAIDKVQTLKILPLSMSAFVGKIFACSFFHLPGVSDALLFLLNVKQHLYEVTVDAISELKKHYIMSSRDRERLYSVFPKQVQHLSGFKGIPELHRTEKFYKNCVPPPSHPVNGIQNPNDQWVRRWCNCDSDIFVSFFRHYIKFASDFISNNAFLNHADPNNIIYGADTMDYSASLYNSPGFIVLLARIFQIFEISINRISLNNPAFSGVGDYFKDQFLNGKNQGNINSNNSNININSGNAGASKQASLFNINDVFFNSIVKVLKTCRDVKFLNRNVSQALIGFIDTLFILVARHTSIYDYNKNGLIISIVYEFAIHVDNDINWEFWLSSSYLMLTKTDHIQIILKNIAFLFNSWDLIPTVLPTCRKERLCSFNHTKPNCKCSNCTGLLWITNDNLSYKHNFANFLVSFPVWTHLFKHWEPIVRSYYIRLLVWKVLGMSEKYTLTERDFIEKSIKVNLELSYDFIARKYEAHGNTESFVADRPLSYRKFSIIPINKNDEFEDSAGAGAGTGGKEELRTTHPYEIFDEAVYSCLSLPKFNLLLVSLEEESDDSLEDKNLKPSAFGESINGKSLVTSLGKIFKKLSAEDRKERTGTGLFADVINSANGLAVATAASAQKSSIGFTTKAVSDRSSSSSRSTSEDPISGSSSPSMMSLATQSFTDFLAASSLKSDGLSSGSSINLSQILQPPELLVKPPEIIRSIYRFELVIDTSIDPKSVVDRAMKREQTSSQNSFPKIPKLPVTSKLYNALFNDSEDSIILDDNSACYETCEEEELLVRPRVTNNPLFDEKTSSWAVVGKSVNEWNHVVHEFETFVRAKVEDYKLRSTDTYDVYFRRMIPFLLVDAANEFKLLNAN